MDLPASIEAAWGLRERPHRGPKPGLSLPRIVEAGVQVAEAEGLAGVSMSRVALRVPISGLPARPNEVAWFECALASLAGTGLTEAQKASVIMLVSGYVRTEASTGADIAAAVRTSGTSASEWMAAYGRLLAKLADPQRFPALATFIASGVFDVADGPDDEFIFGLERILDGVGGLVTARSVPPPEPAE